MDGEGISYAKGSKYKCRIGDYVYYDDFQITANFKAEYNGITHDASANFADSLSEAIAPFSVKDKKEFSPEYLSGYYADAEDVSGEIYQEVSNEIVNNQAAKELSKDSTYSKFNAKPKVNVDIESIKLGLFPVYFLATKNEKGDRISYAVVNGQTGKVAAEIPIDFKKYIIVTVILAVPIFFLLNGFLTLTPIKAAIGSMIFSIISLIILNKQFNQIYLRENRLDDKGNLSNNTQYEKKDKSNFTYSYNKKKKNKMKFKDKLKKIYKPIISLIIVIAILIINPVSDIYYYSGVIVSILMTILSFADIIKQINLLTTRKLPQLGKRGGDENA